MPLIVATSPLMGDMSFTGLHQDGGEVETIEDIRSRHTRLYAVYNELRTALNGTAKDRGKMTRVEVQERMGLLSVEIEKCRVVMRQHDDGATQKTQNGDNCHQNAADVAQVPARTGAR